MRPLTSLRGTNRRAVGVPLLAPAAFVTAGALLLACISTPDGNQLKARAAAAGGDVPPHTGPTGRDRGAHTPDMDPNANASPESLFRGLEADLKTRCGNACHERGETGGAPTWLAPPDAYASIRAYDARQSSENLKLVTFHATASRLFTKGNHLGPALEPTSPLGKQVEAWIQKEADASMPIVGEGAPVMSDATVVKDGEGTLDLRRAGPIDRATLTFTATLDGGMLQLADLTVTAGPESGVHLKHPVFLALSNTDANANPTAEAADPIVKPAVDPTDAFAAVDMTVGAGQSSPLGGGTLVWAGWTPGSKLAVRFGTIERVATQMIAGGCKNVSKFQLISDVFTGGASLNCVSCHAGTGTGVSALDLSGLLPPQDYATACAKVLASVDLERKAESPLLEAVSGVMPHSAGQVANIKAFTATVGIWLGSE
jgi:hypothetical protein